MKTIYYKMFKSAFCNLHLYANDEHVLVVAFDQNHEALKKRLKLDGAINKSNPLIEATISQIKEYFQGERKSFELPLKFEGTDFQMKAWKSLQKIPFGKTISYGEQAVKINSPKAVRAIGSANGKNPLSIVVPCHRVITSMSKISGYAGGADIKEKLLALEQHLHD